MGNKDKRKSGLEGLTLAQRVELKHMNEVMYLISVENYERYGGTYDFKGEWLPGYIDKMKKLLDRGILPRNVIIKRLYDQINGLVLDIPSEYLTKIYNAFKKELEEYEQNLNKQS